MKSASETDTPSEVKPLTNDAVGSSSEPEPLVIQMPVDVRSLAITTLAVLAIVFALRLAQEIVIPIVLGILISYGLDPIVNWLVRRKVPRAVAAALVVAAASGALVFGIYSFRYDTLKVVENLPAATQKLRTSLRISRVEPGSAIQTMQRAATEIERAASEAAGPVSAAAGVTKVQIVEKPLNLRDHLLWGSMGALGLFTQAVMVLFFVFFLLLSGDLFKRKMVKIVGPSWAKKRITVQILDDITAQIERFLFVLLLVNVIVALASYVAFRWVGLEQAGLWALVAGLFNTIPYFGPVIVMLAVGVVALGQFGTLSMAIYVAALSFIITSVEGYLLTPWLQGRAARMNGVAVFTGLLFWGWIWGVWGLLLAVPMMVIVKSVCDRVEDLRPIGELLGE